MAGKSTNRVKLPNATGKRFAIVASQFNETISRGLTESAMTTLLECGASYSDITIIRVPGAFEIPLALLELAETGRFDGLIALGAVIKGETSHFEHISQIAINGCANVSYEYSIPIGCGILTTYTLEQAEERSRDDHSNKGREAAFAAIEMIGVLSEIQATPNEIE